jgi:hypothetical protein
MDNVLLSTRLYLHVLQTPSSMVFLVLAILASIKLQSVAVLHAQLEPHGTVILVEFKQPELVLMDTFTTITQVNVNPQLLRAEIMPTGMELAVFVSQDLT